MDITLNNGVVMPALGLGVFQSPPEETLSAEQVFGDAARSGEKQAEVKEDE